MEPRILALKEADTHPAAEGMISAFAEIHSIRSLEDAKKVARESAEIVLVDLSMRRVDPGELLDRLRRTSMKDALILMADFGGEPAKLLGRLKQLGTASKGIPSRRLGIGQIARVLGVSQETLSRILNVSLRTTSRWMKGQVVPRGKPELSRLARIVSLLQKTLPNTEAIRDYLNHPNPNLGNEKPISILARGEFDRIESDLVALQEGVYI